MGGQVMQGQSQEIQEIALERLVAHPQNANVMPPATMKKLRRHIERTGRYEPLVVRPHPTRPADFELINGHHRKEILAELGHTHAACMVWPLSDAETLLLLATVNRLGGHDSPSKRLALLEQLSDQLDANPHDLALLLPEEEATLAKLLAEDEIQPIADAPPLDDMWEAFTVFMPAHQKTQLLTALKKTNPNLAAALEIWTREHDPNPTPSPLMPP
jgi:ParB-like chromosome segregation protein Spo0J